MCVVKQQTAYELRIRDWSSDVCSSDLHDADRPVGCDALRHMHVQRVGEVEAREHRIAHRQGQLLLARRLYRDAGAVDAHHPGEGGVVKPAALVVRGPADAVVLVDIERLFLWELEPVPSTCRRQPLRIEADPAPSVCEVDLAPGARKGGGL